MLGVAGRARYHQRVRVGGHDRQQLIELGEREAGMRVGSLPQPHAQAFGTVLIGTGHQDELGFLATQQIPGLTQHGGNHVLSTRCDSDDLGELVEQRQAGVAVDQGRIGPVGDQHHHRHHEQQPAANPASHARGPKP